MKLIIGVIDNEYINAIIKTFMENQIRITKLASTGGFLKRGNTTILIGSEEDNLENIVDIIRQKCRVTVGKGYEKIDEDVAGAHLFVVDVNQYMKV